MSEEEKIARFEKRSTELLRDGTDSLDASTRSRLNRARQAALNEIPNRAKRGLKPAWALAGAAALAILVIGVWRTAPQPPDFATELPAMADVSALPASDLELLMAEENLDMLEDLEFYSWLAAEDFTDGEGAAG